jgi:hypothetical protein
VVAIHVLHGDTPLKGIRPERTLSPTNISLRKDVN